MLAPVAAAVVIDKNEYRLVPAYGSYDAKWFEETVSITCLAVTLVIESLR